MMTKSIVFDASKSFAENFDLFLADLEAVDKELAAIARANAGALGSGLITHSQKITVAARAMAEKKAIGHLS